MALPISFQIFTWTELGNSAPLHHEDVVYVANGCESVGDDERGPPF